MCKMENCRRDLNKARKKITRCIGILQRDLPGIQISDIPTKHIFIGNAGLTTNADESSLVELITSVGSGLEALTLLPGKQYSFASFTCPQLARSVFIAAHGILGVRGSTTPVYMAFVDKVPLDPSPIKFKYPPGLTVIEDFVSPEEEIMLMNLIEWNDAPLTIAEGRILKHRQVRHFGYEFQYNTNSVDKDHPLTQGIPAALSHIVRRITERGCMPATPDQLTVNRYLPGQGIPPHVDTHSSFTGEILSLSVGGGVNMDFRHAGGTTIHNSGGEAGKDKPPHFVVYLPPRSLCVMTGPARYEWSHGICPRMTDVVASKGGALGLQLMPRRERLSFTFRKIRVDECPCQNPLVCDSYIKKQQLVTQNARNTPGVAVEEKSASKLEKDHVLQVYDKIAGHFSVTRHKPWPQVLEFVCSLPLGSLLLDVGCGNGKYMGHNKQVFQVGCDTSSELMKICNTRGFEVLTCNCLHLPYRNSVFDATVCIAVIHHLATESRRLSAIAEMVRVLRVGGRGLVYVWAMEQRRGDKKSTYLKQSKTNKHDNIRHQHDSYSKDLVKNDSEDVKVGLICNNPSGKDLKIKYDNGENRHICGMNCGAGSIEREAVGQDGATSLPVHINRTEFVQQDMLVPWKLKPPKKVEVMSERRGKCEKECAKYHCCRDNKHQGCSAFAAQTKHASSCSDAHNATNNRSCQSKTRKKTVPTENGNDQVFHRYYHVFKQGELEQLCSQLNVSVVKSYYDEGNWCVIFEKIT